MKKVAVICDRKGELGRQTLHDFFPNDTPAIIGLYNHSAVSLEKATTTLKAMDSNAANQSILTWRCPPNQQLVPSSETPVLTIPWCDEGIFTAWLNFLSDQSQGAPQVQWFFPANMTPDLHTEICHWQSALANLWQCLGKRITTIRLAKALYCCRSKLKKRCQLLFNTSPGNLLRVLWVFEHTAWCMQQEKQAGRKRRSPLNEIPGNFYRIFKTVTGIGYQSFLQQSQNEHWVAVWMRHWRRNGRQYPIINTE